MPIDRNRLDAFQGTMRAERSPVHWRPRMSTHNSSWRSSCQRGPSLSSPGVADHTFTPGVTRSTPPWLDCHCAHVHIVTLGSHGHLTRRGVMTDATDTPDDRPMIPSAPEPFDVVVVGRRLSRNSS